MRASRALPIAVAAIAFATTVPALAGPDDHYYEPKAKWVWAGAVKFDTAKAACQYGVQDMAAADKFTYVRVKPGKDEKEQICIYRRPNNEPFDREITRQWICLDGNQATYIDNEGHPDKCLWPNRPECAPAAYSRACTDPKSPPGVERSERCTQQAENPTTKEEAEKRSKANRDATAKKNPALTKNYQAAVDYYREKELDKVKTNELMVEGFPEFKDEDLYDQGPNDVIIGKLCGSDDGDFAAANNVAGYGSTPEGYTWHHHEDLGRFQLVKRSVHSKVGHTGGRAIWKRANNLDDYPRCCP